jgi:molybdenum cofactor cytidylyltransferase
MAAALRTGPELIGCPRHAGPGVAHLHLGATPLTTNVTSEVGHGGILASYDPCVIPAIVLAAGKSTRMGRLKANLPVGPVGPVKNDTFLTHLVRTLRDAGIDDVVIVVGHEKDAVLGSFAGSGLSARFVENTDYESGQLSSLLAGLRVVDRPGVVAALVTLVDVPFVSAATVRAVIDRYHQTHAPVVRPARKGRYGHPMLVDRALFDQLRHADPGEGAKPVVRAHATPNGEVEVDDEGAFDDIDTPEEYERALSVFGRAARVVGKNDGRN